MVFNIRDSLITAIITLSFVNASIAKDIEDIKKKLNITEDLVIEEVIETPKTTPKAEVKPTPTPKPNQRPTLPVTPTPQPTPTPKPQPKAQTTIKPTTTPSPKPTATEEGLFDKILNIIFGSDKKQPFKTPPSPSSNEDERISTTEESIERLSETFADLESTEIIKSINKALKNSATVAKAKIEAEITKRQNTFTPVPQFNIGNDLATGKTIIGAGFQIPLEPLFTGKQRERQALLNVKQQEFEVMQRVIEQHKKINHIKNRIKTLEDKNKYAEQLSKNTEEQYKAGIARIEDVIKAKEMLWGIERESFALQQELKVETERLRFIEEGGK